MKTLAFLIVVLLFLSCKKDEPKSLIVINGVNQSQYKNFKDHSFMESVIILYVGTGNEFVRSEKFLIAYSTVKDLSSYQVTSTILDDNIVSIKVLVQFYSTINNLSISNYQSEDILIHEGINTYTITENDLVDQSLP